MISTPSVFSTPETSPSPPCQRVKKGRITRLDSGTIANCCIASHAASQMLASDSASFACRGYCFFIPSRHHTELFRSGYKYVKNGLRRVSLDQSSQLFSTVSRTRFVYSLRLSLYRFEASTFAGEPVLGSLRRLLLGRVSHRDFAFLASRQSNLILPLDARKDSRNVVCGAPAVL